MVMEGLYRSCGTKIRTLNYISGCLTRDHASKSEIFDWPREVAGRM